MLLYDLILFTKYTQYKEKRNGRKKNRTVSALSIDMVLRWRIITAAPTTHILHHLILFYIRSCICVTIAKCFGGSSATGQVQSSKLQKTTSAPFDKNMSRFRHKCHVYHILSDGWRKKSRGVVC